MAMKKVYAFVPAKGTSERVENKNMRFFDGERLYIRALKTLLQCKEIDKVFLDTESEEMYRLADYLPIHFMKRDPKFATNSTDGHQMMLNEITAFPDADIYVQLLCTSPFIRPETIDNGIKILKQGYQYDSALLMRKDKIYFWNAEGHPQYNSQHIPNSKDLPDTFMESMGLYIIKKETALEHNRRYGRTPLMLFGAPEESIDVNTGEDLAYATTYAAGLREKENRRLKLLKHFLTSPLLSDLIDDITIEKKEACGAILNGFISNMPTKILGRANTLRLRQLRQDENFHGIYDALESYSGIANNNIIVVENETPQFAYFGDLNARLAIRAGASGAIINGATRDYTETAALGFPVFARNYNATDVRRRATLDYINKPIQIDGITITPGDLIFVDACSAVVIYQKYETEIINRTFEKIQNEKDIIQDIMEQKYIDDIVQKRGAF